MRSLIALAATLMFAVSAFAASSATGVQVVPNEANRRVDITIVWTTLITPASGSTTATPTVSISGITPMPSNQKVAPRWHRRSDQNRVHKERPQSR